jgi:hypothetical protein
MKEITTLIDKYRESTRHLWNIYFREMKDGWHEFIDVNSALFQGLVLTQIGESFGHHKVYQSINVVPSIPPSGYLEIMYLPNQAISGQWQVEGITNTEGEYNFIEFFDWRGDEDIMDNNYVLAKATNVSSNGKLENNRVLFKYEDVRFYQTEISD